jgi:hypothetical protein
MTGLHTETTLLEGITRGDEPLKRCAQTKRFLLFFDVAVAFSTICFCLVFFVLRQHFCDITFVHQNPLS